MPGVIDKHARFVRVSEHRINRVLVELSRVERIGSPNYDYSHEEALALIGTLEESLSRVRHALLRRYPAPAFRIAA